MKNSENIMDCSTIKIYFNIDIGKITYHFKDGTIEIWKRNKLGRLYKAQKRAFYDR